MEVIEILKSDRSYFWKCSKNNF